MMSRNIIAPGHAVDRVAKLAHGQAVADHLAVLLGAQLLAHGVHGRDVVEEEHACRRVARIVAYVHLQPARIRAAADLGLEVRALARRCAQVRADGRTGCLVDQERILPPPAGRGLDVDAGHPGRTPTTTRTASPTTGTSARISPRR
jgi:hypothetical protein